jgi:hypothetical protein
VNPAELCELQFLTDKMPGVSRLNFRATSTVTLELAETKNGSVEQFTDGEVDELLCFHVSAGTHRPDQALAIRRAICTG